MEAKLLQFFLSTKAYIIYNFIHFSIQNKVGYRFKTKTKKPKKNNQQTIVINFAYKNGKMSKGIFKFFETY